MGRVFRWIAGSGFRVTMLIAVLVFVYHVTNELRVLFGSPPNFHQRLELTALDVKFSARGKRPPERWGVAIAAADEKAVQEFGPLPWKRSVHGKLVNALTDQGAAAIAFDMTFDQPSLDPSIEASRSLAMKVKSSGVLDAPKQIEATAKAVEKVASDLSKVKVKKVADEVRAFIPPLKEAATSARGAKASIDKLAGAIESDVEAGEDPDATFIEANNKSGKVVLGVIALSKLEAESLGIGGPELARALHAVSTSTIGELVSKGGDGLDYVHPNAKEAFE